MARHLRSSLPQILPVVLAALMLMLASSEIGRAAGNPEAKRLAREAAQHYGAGRYEQAAEGFRQAHEVDGAPVFLFNIGRCMERLGRPADAIAYLERYLIESPRARNKDAVEQLLGDLTALVSTTMGRVRVVSDPSGASVFFDDAETALGQTPLSRWVPAGAHTLRFELHGHLPAERPVDLAAGDRADLRVRLTSRDAPGELVLLGAPAGATIEIDAAPLALARTYSLAPGQHTLTVSSEGSLPWSATFDIAPAGSTVVTVPAGALAVLPVPEPTLAAEDAGFEVPVGGWIMGALALASAGAAVAFHVLAFEDARQARDYASDPGADRARWEELGGQAEEKLLIAEIGYGVAGAAALAAIVWTVVDNVGEDDPPPADVTIAPWLRTPGATVQVRY